MMEDVKEHWSKFNDAHPSPSQPHPQGRLKVTAQAIGLA
jgi:hypothetical protein